MTGPDRRKIIIVAGALLADLLLLAVFVGPTALVLLAPD